jgi:hypothetical protein
MKELYNKKHRKGLQLDGLSYDDRSQAVILNKGMPILSKVNNEDIVGSPASIDGLSRGALL